MDSFSGFTEEDIQRLSDNPEDTHEKGRETVKPSVSKNMQRHRNRLTQKNFTRERILKKHQYSNQNLPAIDIPKEARLSIPQIPEDEEVESNKTPAEDETGTTIKENSEEMKETPIEVESKTEKDTEALTTNTDKHGSIPSAKVIPFFLCAEANDKTLEEFETRQRMMEEQNKQRKEILKKAIADRARRTHEETKRLNEIEGELKKLDLLLSNDVAILRNQIESASLEFSEAQKRYDRAEKEFLDAKLDMFNKKERKELLTSHLCTIIEQNEMRKAKRLSDLMMKLEIGCSSMMTSHITVETKAETEPESIEKSKADDC
ncbi:RAB6-interacting golgin [Nilaparvata lugens]|uniref:RAB6-interacting golgin n=1 Tax=Nilaparvata lugens TaxID=108931 RepID=UPI00193CEACA|nr:RAB6-interacting golgin [Nilaparvata lugens]